MKQGWVIKKLGEIARIINGYAFDSKLFSTDENDMPLIRIRDIKKGYTETFYKGKYSDNYIVKNGDYIIGMDGEFNITEWGGGDALLNQRVCKIEIVDDSVIGRYVLRFLSIELKRIEDATSFVTVKHLSSKSLLSIPIPVPERAEQERIVGELDCLSGIIAAKRAQLRELDTLAQSIFYTMFGDPITNDKGWQTKKLGEITEQINGLWVGKNPPFVTIAVIRNTNFTKDCNLDTNNIAYIQVEQKQYSTRKLKCGDIIIEKSGGSDKQPVGRPILFNIEDGEYSFSNFTSVLRVVDNTLISPKFLHKFLVYIYNQGYTLNMQSKTTGIRNLNFKLYKNMNVPIPPIALQNEFAEKIENIERQKELITKSIKETEDLFNSRMSYYFD